MSAPLRKVAVIVVLVALAATSTVLAPPASDAQIRPRCGSPGQALASALGEGLGGILGRFSRATQARGGLAGTRAFENVNDVWQRCAEPYFPDPPEPPRDEPSDEILSAPDRLPPEFGPDPFGFGGAWGDPHMRTHDGVGYGFQAAGDFVLVRDVGADVEIQARFVRWTGQSPASVTQAAAIRVGDDVVTLNDLPDARFYTGDEVRVNGEPMAFLPGGWHNGDGLSILRVEDSIIITTDSGYAINYTGRSLIVDAPTGRAGEAVGLLGDNDRVQEDDIKLADGTPVDHYDSEVLYGQFLDDWFVDGADSLFVTPFDVDALGPIRPDEIIRIDTLPADLVQVAIRACAAAGLSAGLGLEECVYDVSVTGDESFIDATGGFLHGEGTVDSATLDPELTSSETLVLEPDTPTIARGILDGLGTAHELVLAGDATQPRVVRVAEPCSQLLAPVLTILVSGNVTLRRPLVCDRSIPVPAGDVRLHVVQRYDSADTYSLSIGPVGTTDLGVLSDGDTASASLLAQDRAVGRLDFAAGQLIFLDAISGDCSTHATVSNAAGDILGSRGACVDVGTVELSGEAPFTLTVENRRSERASFELTVTVVGQSEASTGSLDTELVLRVGAPGQTPTLDLELTAGQRLFIQNVTNDGLGQVVLRDPAGEVVAERLAVVDIGVVDVEVAGTYQLSLEPRGSDTGEHRLIVHDVPPDSVTEADFGAEVTGVVRVPGQLAVLTVDAQAGDRLFIDAVEDAGIADISLVDPSGATLVETLSFSNTGPVEVAESGEHQLVIRPRGAIVGPFQFIIHQVPDDVVVAASLGDEVSVEITTPGQSATVTFEAQAGQDMTIDSLANGGIGDVVLVAPSGAVVGEFLSFQGFGPVAAPESGTYQLILDPREDIIGTQTWSLN